MPEDVIARLAQFSPRFTLDRDELLFAAGRASAPSPRPWQWLAAVLALGQCVTLTLWLFGSPTPVSDGQPEVPVIPLQPSDSEIDEPSEPLSSSSYWVLSRSSVESLVPPNLSSMPDETTTPEPMLSARSPIRSID